MARSRISHRAAALSGAFAVAVATLASLVPHASAAAATTTPLSPGTSAVVPLGGIAHLHPVAAGSTPAPHVGGAEAKPKPHLLLPKRGQASPSIAGGSAVQRSVDTGAASPRTVSPNVAGGVGQVLTAQGVSHDQEKNQFGIGVTPPDTVVGASSSTVVEAVNSTLLTMNRDGSNATLSKQSDIWVQGLVGAGTVYSISDPRIVFDTESNRWFLSTLIYDPNLFVPANAATAHSWIGLAVSTTSSPTAWNVYAIQGTAGILMDQPNLGVNSDKVTVGSLDFDYTHVDSQGNPSNPPQGDLLVVNKANALASAPLHTTKHLGSTTEIGYAPAVTRTGGTTTEYVPFNNRVSGTPQLLSVLAITGVPGVGGGIAITQHDITMCSGCGNGAFTLPPASGIPQPGTGTQIDTGDDRFNSTIFQNGKLWTGGNTALSGGSTQSGLSLFEVDTSGFTLPVATRIRSTGADSLAYPGIALDQNGNAFIAFSLGSGSRVMSAGTLVYVPSTGGLLSSGVLNGSGGSGFYDCGACGSGVSRWGDYSGAAVDPADPNDVWIAAEYSATSPPGNTTNWATVLTRTTIAAPTISSVSVGSGPTSGGTMVWVTGGEFDESSTTALFGGVAATTSQWIDAQHIVVQAPPHPPGPVGVAAASVTGTSSPGPGFTFVLPPKRNGYWMDATDGGIFSFGTATFRGSMGGTVLNQPAVGMAAVPSGDGYWLVARDGGIFSFGTGAGFHGSMGGRTLNQPIVGMAATPSGNGYWMVASDGGIFTFGDAGFFGSTGAIRLNQPIVGMAATPTGLGYWMVASDGGVFSFGDAVFWGSTGGIHLNQPIVGMAATTDGYGYWLVATDGGVFTFGTSATFFGSTGGIHLNQPIVGMAQTGDDGGYWLVATDGGIFTFGDGVFFGSMGGTRLNKPVVGMTAGPV
jgi:hypothetical protein